MTVRILVVDQNPVTQTGLESILENSEFQIAHFTNSVEFANQWLRTKFVQDGQKAPVEIILCDFQLKDGSSTDLQQLANEFQIPLVLFSEWNNPVFIARMVELGVYGLIHKSESPEDILASLHTVRSGKKALKRKDTRKVTGALATPRLETHIDFPLTQREFSVLKSLSKGLSNKLVAEELEISYETVKEHVQHILAKLGVSDRTQAAVMAVRKGLI